METYENYHKPDIKLPFKLKNPDGSYVEATNPKTLESAPLVRRLDSEEVRRLKGQGYTLEVVEPAQHSTFIEKSQTTHDKDED